MKRFLTTLALLMAGTLLAAEVIPPPPANHFNDYAGVIPAATSTELDTTLAQFEREQSSQIVVAIFPKMQSDSSVEDYTVRVAQSWKVGQSGKNNGAVLFIFVQDRKMYLQVGYGLEGVLPDALCKRIIADEITPHFRAENYDQGVRAGVTAILAAARGEYKGTGATHRESRSDPLGAFILGVIGVAFIVFFLLIVIVSRGRHSRRGWLATGGGWTGGWSSGGGGWSSGGGGWSSGGGGGFSGGGGSFGGGGAGGSW